MVNFTKSGTHNAESWDFCNGQLDVLYVHMFVRSKPGMTEAVTAMMPTHAHLDSENCQARAHQDSTSTPQKERAQTVDLAALGLRKKRDGSLL